MAESSLSVLGTIVRLLEVLAWPSVVLTAVLVLRGDLTYLVGRLSKLRYGRAEAEFTDALERAERVAPQDVVKIHRPEDVKPSLDDADRFEELFDLAKVSARGAVMDAWRELELAAIGAALAKQRRVTGPLDRVSGIAAVEQLQVNGDVSDKILEFYRELRSLRNKANSAEFQLTTDDARKYVLLALQLAGYFRQFRRAVTSSQRDAAA